MHRGLSGKDFWSEVPWKFRVSGHRGLFPEIKWPSFQNKGLGSKIPNSDTGLSRCLRDHSKSAILLVFVLPLFFGCSFNGFFLHPERLERDVDRISIHDPMSERTMEFLLGETLGPSVGEGEGPGYGIESVLFENGMGTELHGWILTPPDSVEPNGISLFLLHGNAGNLTHHCGLMKPFLLRGYKVFIFDYSGYGFSKGKAARNTLLPDSRAALEFMLGHPAFSDDKLLIYGQSLGGHIAPTLFLEYAEKFEGLILEGAFSTPKDIAADKAGFFGRLLTSQDHTALSSVPKVNAPILVVHGTRDEVVPFEQGKKLFEGAKEPKSFLKEEMGHLEGALLLTDSIDEAMKRMVRP